VTRSAPARVARAAVRRGEHPATPTSTAAIDRVVPSDPLASQLARAVSARTPTTIDSPLLQRFALVRANDVAYPQPKHRGHGAGGEAKAFFATKDVFRAGDAALQGGVRLAKTDRYLWNTQLRERLTRSCRP
jgi:hypothetical protein